MTRKIAPYGSWRSPITADLIASRFVRLAAGPLHRGTAYWLESRPAERGRNVIVRRRADGQVEEVNPAPFNARTRVHEYGGGAFTVHGEVVYFANFTDQRLYRVAPGEPPTPITPPTDPPAALRYADAVVDEARQRLICVREDHRDAGRGVVNTIAAIPLNGGEQQTLVSGNDFYASPRLSPDGRTLVWLTWDHPRMPWDGTELWMATVRDDGTLGEAQHIVGGPTESIFQPTWSPDGELYFVSDRNGWWNLYRWRGGVVESLVEMEAEFGLPQWIFGLRTYAFLSAREIVCTYTRDGLWHLARLDVEKRTLTPIETPYTDVRGLHADGGQVLFRGGSPTELTAIVRLDVDSGEMEVLKRSGDLPLDPGYISTPRPITFPTEHGLKAHALFYPPKNKDVTAPDDEKPPLIVISHGGPTSATTSALNLNIQYWTSRGFAVLDVNYGGSTGYGRAYRERLNGQWGVVDVDDCVNGAKYLVAQGEVDGERLIIRGGSAGGYTTLCALTFRDLFKAGASYYGIGDLEALTRETHKFESHYLDRLIGPYPERRDLYLIRSPIHHIEGLNCPVIFLQGAEDRIVPPDQAEAMVAALRAKGIPVAYLLFEGEQHGFRRAENIRRALEAELYFYARVFGFALADPVPPIPIENLD